MQPTYHPSKLKRVRMCGFRARMATKGGRSVGYLPGGTGWYRKVFSLDKADAGKSVSLVFDGAYMLTDVWVNGRKAGYAEDSCLPSEFDITAFLIPGENVLAVEVYRWCDGSYLEDQDMTRYSGIYRDVSLWAMPDDGIWDFTVKAGAPPAQRQPR